MSDLSEGEKAAFIRAVVDAAVAWRHGPMGEREGHRGKLLADAVDAFERALNECRCPRDQRVYCHADNCHGGADLIDNELIWVARTMQDVRGGDTVRMPSAPDTVARVVFALPLDWHVRSGGHGHRARFDDLPLEQRRMSVRMEYPGALQDNDGRPALLEMPASMAVEIRLSKRELAAIELLGWDNRVWIEIEGSNSAE